MLTFYLFIVWCEQKSKTRWLINFITQSLLFPLRNNSFHRLNFQGVKNFTLVTRPFQTWAPATRECPGDLHMWIHVYVPHMNISSTREEPSRMNESCMFHMWIHVYITYMWMSPPPPHMRSLNTWTYPAHSCGTYTWIHKWWMFPPHVNRPCTFCCFIALGPGKALW